jgi:hypothetical protein
MVKWFVVAVSLLAAVAASILLLLRPSQPAVARGPLFISLERVVDGAAGERVQVHFTLPGSDGGAVPFAAEATTERGFSEAALRGLATRAKSSPGVLIYMGPVQVLDGGGWVAYVAADTNRAVSIDFGGASRVDSSAAGGWPLLLRGEAAAVWFSYEDSGRKVRVQRVARVSIR